ncbi:MAG: C40 family peptidase [Brumimicrobium sp.]|nr:C40 family peptidase [Brumimicrobium sp.]
MRFSISIFLIFITFSTFSQVPEFDNLEMRYDQAQYKTVYKRANKLLQNPEFDYSFLPRYYVALSGLQLAQDEKWLKRNKNTIKDATQTFKELYQTLEGKRLLEAHLYEVSALKYDLKHWMEELNRKGNSMHIKDIDFLVNTLFKDVPQVEKMKEDQLKEPSYKEPEIPSKEIDKSKLTQREKVVATAKELIGVPYKWAGTTPQGFDCSGFTGYVFDKSVHQTLGRSASDQYKDVKKIKDKNVRPGDLIFFGTSTNISHVGIVYATENDSIQMIHSSTSIGISIVDIYDSAYWKKRLVGFGAILTN